MAAMTSYSLALVQCIFGLSGIQTHCKFERRPLQEIVHQLSDSDNFVLDCCKQSLKQLLHPSIHLFIHRIQEHTFSGISNPALLPCKIIFA